MISRRTFGGGVAALIGLLLARLPSAAMPVQFGGVSPRLAALADAWAEEGTRFEQVKREVFQHDPRTMSRRFYPDPECKELQLWRATKRQLAEASAFVLREPARTPSDVILKYHVVDMNYGYRPVDDEDWIGLRGGTLYAQVATEAARFGIEINPFWLGETPFAAIGGDRNSPRWAEVARWRYGKFAG